jgi:hypothetical protein
VQAEAREHEMLLELAYGVIWSGAPDERSEEGAFIECAMGWAGLVPWAEVEFFVVWAQ